MSIASLPPKGGMPLALPVPVPVWAAVVTLLLEIFTICLIVFCFTQRLQYIRSWRTVTAQTWLLFAVYLDSFLFVAITTILKHFNLNSSFHLCEGTFFLCIVCYASTKVILYFVFVEKVHIIRNPLGKSRKKDKLYIFNVCSIILPYFVLFLLCFAYRETYFNTKGVCILGIYRPILIPICGIELMMNIWLTAHFVLPIRNLHSVKNKVPTGAHRELRRVAIRTTIGSCATLTSTMANLSLTAALDGETSWLCMMLCNLDILWAVLVLHWMARVDRDQTPHEAPAEPSRSPAALEAGKRCSEPDYDKIILNEVACKTPAVEKNNPLAGTGILLVREYSAEDVEEGKSDSGSINEGASE